MLSRTLQPDEADGDSADDIQRVRTEFKWLTSWSCNVLLQYVSKAVIIISYSSRDSVCGDE